MAAGAGAGQACVPQRRDVVQPTGPGGLASAWQATRCPHIRALGPSEGSRVQRARGSTGRMLSHLPLEVVAPDSACHPCTWERTGGGMLEAGEGCRGPLATQHSNSRGDRKRHRPPCPKHRAPHARRSPARYLWGPRGGSGGRPGAACGRAEQGPLLRPACGPEVRWPPCTRLSAPFRLRKNGDWA